MKRKSLAILATSFVGILALTSCGDETNSSNASGSDVTSLDDGDIQRDDDGNIIYNNVNLKMWAVTTGDDANTQDSIIAGFNDAYNGMIKVSTEHISRYDMETRLSSTMSFDRENAPDLLFTHGARAATYNSNGWLQPIEPYATKADVLIDKDDYVASLLDAVTLSGRIYGLPQDVHSGMIEVRTDILEKNGLFIPKNYSELVTISEQAISLAKEGNLWIRGVNSDGIGTTTWRKASSLSQYYPFPISYGDMWVHEFFGYTAALQNGGKIIDENGYPAWDSNEVAAGLQVLRDWVNPTSGATNTHALSQNYGSGYDVGYTPFLRGDAIFKLNGPWEWAKDVNEFENEFKSDGGASNIETMNLSSILAKDSSKDYARYVKGEGHAFMLLSTVKSMTKASAAMVFADYMVNNAGITWAQRGHLPSLKSIENSSEYKDNEIYTNLISKWGTADDYQVIQPTPYYDYIDSYFKSAVSLALDANSMNKPIKQILDEKYQDCVDYIELNL